MLQSPFTSQYQWLGLWSLQNVLWLSTLAFHFLGLAKLEISNGLRFEKARGAFSPPLELVIVEDAVRDEKQEERMARAEKGGDSALPERRNVKKPVLSDGATASKAGLMNKICSVFFRGRNFEDVGSYVLQDVLIPTIIDGIANSGKAAIDGVFYGESKPGSASKYGNQKTNYNKSSSYGSMTRTSDRTGGIVASGGRGDSRYESTRSRRGFEAIKLSSRRDAENVLKYLQDIVDQYDNVSVSEYYEAFDDEGISALARYTDVNYGWFDLSDVDIVHIPGGWVIDLPDPVRLR